MDGKYPPTKYESKDNRTPLFMPSKIPEGLDEDKVYSVENWMATICVEGYDIDIDTDGIIIWWALGVFVDYIATKTSVTNRDISFICVCSLALVLKYCFDETHETNLGVVYDHMIMDDKIHIKMLRVIELDILTTSAGLIECFRQHTPPGFTIDVVSLIRIEDDEKNVVTQ